MVLKAAGSLDHASSLRSHTALTKTRAPGRRGYEKWLASSLCHIGASPRGVVVGLGSLVVKGASQNPPAPMSFQKDEPNTRASFFTSNSRREAGNQRRRRSSLTGAVFGSLGISTDSCASSALVDNSAQLAVQLDALQQQVTQLMPLLNLEETVKVRLTQVEGAMLKLAASNVAAGGGSGGRSVPSANLASACTGGLGGSVRNRVGANDGDAGVCAGRILGSSATGTRVTSVDEARTSVIDDGGAAEFARWKQLVETDTGIIQQLKELRVAGRLRRENQAARARARQGSVVRGQQLQGGRDRNLSDEGSLRGVQLLKAGAVAATSGSGGEQGICAEHSGSVERSAATIRAERAGGGMRSAGTARCVSAPTSMIQGCR